MTTNEIEKIENELSISLPHHYKEFIRNYPNELVELKLNHDLFSNNPEWIIQINKMIQSGKVPKEYIAIGIDIGGNLYYIKNETNNTYVYWIDHEEVDYEPVESTELIWESILEKKHKNLTDFKNWLIDFWGESWREILNN